MNTFMGESANSPPETGMLTVFHLAVAKMFYAVDLV